MIALIIIGLVHIAIIAPLLALHHRHIHLTIPPADGIPELCFLQPNDVCATRCTHENWILASLALAAIMIISGALITD